MASIFSKWKHYTFPFIILFIALLFLITNFLFFTINYTRQLQEEFQNVTTYLKNLRNPDWFEVVSHEIKDEKIKIGLVNMGRIKDEAHTHANRNARHPEWFEVVAREFKNERINIGLVNVDGMMMDEVIHTNAHIEKIHFDRIGDDVRWSHLTPERIDENSTCLDIPMPRFDNYRPLDVVVARVDCEGGGLRDVFRLQVNLVVANLMVRIGRWDKVLAVFVGSCEPMWEIFRCDDLLWNEENYWIYKPKLMRMKEMVLMPVGACQFVPPFSQFGMVISFLSYRKF